MIDRGTARVGMDQPDLLRQAPVHGAGALTRRGLISTAAAAAGGALLGDWGTQSRARAQSSAVVHWDMAWGPAAYVNQGVALADQFSANHPFKATYESIPWENEYEKFASAIAAGAAPNASSGPAYQPWQFWEQGALHPTDTLIAALEKSGVAADFAPGTLDLMKYQGASIGVPFNIDIRVLYYRKSLLEKAGVQPPTTWDELLTVCAALKKQGVYGFNMEGRPTHGGWQAIVSLMINNGGGYLNQGRPDAVRDVNIETLDFFNKMVKDEFVDPASIQYSYTDANQAFGSGRVAIAVRNPGFNALFTPDVVADMGILSPLTSPHGTKGTVYWVNPLMIYEQPGNFENTNTWLEWFLDNMKVFWEKSLIPALPPRTSWGSIPAITSNPFQTVAVKEWLPVGQSDSGGVIIPQMNAITQGTGLDQMTQQVIQGTTPSKQILETLQSWLEETVS
jgi:multiple sugar transport system substrate-binding protein